MMRFLAAALLVLSVLPPLGPAWAKDGPPLPRPDPKGVWHVITHDDATTTSKCIGSQETPLCTAESLLAAMLRGDPALFLRLRGWGRIDPDELTPKRPGEWVKYQILSAGRFKPGDKRTDDRNRDLGWVPGDVWIVMDIRDCDGTRCSHPVPSGRYYWPERFVLHKTDAGWIVVNLRELHWRQ